MYPEGEQGGARGRGSAEEEPAKAWLAEVEQATGKGKQAEVET